MTIKLQLLQNAVSPINDLRIVETLDEVQSITTGYGGSSSLKYQTYYDLLKNACVRYDRTKKATIVKRGHIYQKISTPNIDDFFSQLPFETPDRDPYMVLIHSVMNYIILAPINLSHLCLLDINSNTDYSGQTLIPNLIHSQRNQPEKNGLVPYICQDIYKHFRQETKEALQKYNVEAIQKFKASQNLNETDLTHDV